jgi:hypothetical protein
MGWPLSSAVSLRQAWLQDERDVVCLLPWNRESLATILQTWIRLQPPLQRLGVIVPDATWLQAVQCWIQPVLTKAGKRLLPFPQQSTLTHRTTPVTSPVDTVTVMTVTQWDTYEGSIYPLPGTLCWLSPDPHQVNPQHARTLWLSSPVARILSTHWHQQGYTVTTQPINPWVANITSYAQRQAWHQAMDARSYTHTIRYLGSQCPPFAEPATWSSLALVAQPDTVWMVDGLPPTQAAWLSLVTLSLPNTHIHLWQSRGAMPVWARGFSAERCLWQWSMTQWQGRRLPVVPPCGMCPVCQPGNYSRSNK